MMTPFSLARQLSSVHRYSRDFSVKNESVLEHIGFCAIYCLSLGERAVSEGLTVDFSILLKKAILHDIEEAETGDITRKAKYHSDKIREALVAFESEAALKICQEVFGGANYHLWISAKNGGIEGKIVALSDYAAVAYHVANEIYTLGNNGFLRVHREAQDFLNIAIDKETEPFFRSELRYISRVLNGSMPI